MSAQQARTVVKQQVTTGRSVTAQFTDTAKALARMGKMELAARYLRKRGFSFHAAHWILLNCAPRRPAASSTALDFRRSTWK